MARASVIEAVQHVLPVTNRIALAVVCLHISALLYCVLGFAMFIVFRIDDLDAGLAIATAMMAFCLALAVGIEVVVWGLKRRKFWAWIAGLCIFGIYIPSLFLPLGALGIWGLLDAGSRAEFGIGVAKTRGFEPTRTAPAAEMPAAEVPVDPAS